MRWLESETIANCGSDGVGVSSLRMARRRTAPDWAACAVPRAKMIARARCQPGVMSACSRRLAWAAAGTDETVVAAISAATAPAKASAMARGWRT